MWQGWLCTILCSLDSCRPGISKTPSRIMDTELKCNRLTCRRSLTDKAVVVCPLVLWSFWPQIMTTSCILHVDDLWVFHRLTSQYSTEALSANRFAYILWYIYQIRRFEVLENIELNLVDCANELFSAARLCPGVLSRLSLGFWLNHESVWYGFGRTARSFNYSSLRTLMEP